MSDESGDVSKVMETTNQNAGVTQGEHRSDESMRNHLTEQVRKRIAKAPNGPNGGKNKM